MTDSASKDFPPAEPTYLMELVDYQDGSVVSRTIARSKAGTLTLFAFAEGQGLSEHSAPYDAWVQILDGEGELTIDGRPIVASTGQTVLMPGNVPHSVFARTQFKMLLIMIRG